MARNDPRHRMGRTNKRTGSRHPAPTQDVTTHSPDHRRSPRVSHLQLARHREERLLPEEVVCVVDAPGLSVGKAPHDTRRLAQRLQSVLQSHQLCVRTLGLLLRVFVPRRSLVAELRAFSGGTWVTTRAAERGGTGDVGVIGRGVMLMAAKRVGVTGLKRGPPFHPSTRIPSTLPLASHPPHPLPTRLCAPLLLRPHARLRRRDLRLRGPRLLGQTLCVLKQRRHLQGGWRQHCALRRVSVEGWSDLSAL